ncbi:MAG: hypothetical protein CL931_04560 [Deltaproteobacteria bacterium]|nr:hypothetical protein [Deltaproteobacteria bacterium]
MTKRIADRCAPFFGVLLFMGAVGCATGGTNAAETVPAHPFPRWVSYLETGVTPIAEVAAVFGDPAEIEEAVRGGLRWRYAYAEIHWAPDDPDRPAVTADGRPVEAEPTWVDQAAKGLAKTGRFLEGLVVYPPRQPKGPRMRTMDATVHDLELRFDVEGVLAHYRYAPRQDRVRIRVDGR